MVFAFCTAVVQLISFRQVVPQVATAPRLVSQPLSGLLSQSALAPVQLGVQTPPTQGLVPPAAVQTVPQEPQLLTSVALVLSQPLLLLPSQFWCRPSHAGVHTLEVQGLVPPAAVQTVPQPPQFIWSLVASTHAPAPGEPPLQ
jgi:hypothetical protein